MSTRASAPRCASCGMPLAPAADSCAVCGARVPLIARPATAQDEQVPAADADVTARPAPVVTERPASPAPLPAELPAPLSAGARGGVADDAARAVRSASRPPGAAVRPQDVPGIGTRVLAHAIDVLVAVAAAGAGLVVDTIVGSGTPVVAAVLGVAVAVVQVVAEGRAGATVGARVQGLRTVDDVTGAVPGVPRALLRQLVLGLGAVLLVGNWVVAASGAWDPGPRRRGWHDKASGTTVVRAAAAPSAPYPTGARGRSGSGASPWTPTAPPAPARVPTGSDALFAPPPLAVPAAAAPPPLAEPPVVTERPSVAPPAPDLLPPAPTGGPSRPEAAGRPAADLLPPPPASGRRVREDTPPTPAATVPSPEPSPAFDEDLAELEHTRVRDPESLRRRTGTLALHFDTGERVRVVGRGLVGRGPRAEDGEDILHVVALNDAARSLSRVHAEFGPHAGATDDDAGIWVADRRSTNGTVVVDPTGAARVLPPGARAVVGPGWTVRLGDREARVEDD